MQHRHDRVYLFGARGANPNGDPDAGNLAGVDPETEHGLVKRDLRRWDAGRESSFAHHWAKRSALPLLAFTWVIYLALPISLYPSCVVLPFATLFALSVAVTASEFNKYL